MSEREIDRQLVERAQRGDKRAFELLVEKYQRKLARLLSRREDPVAFSRLQALAASLYQLTIDEFKHVLSTFPLIEKAIKDAAYETYVATEAQRTQR